MWIYIPESILFVLYVSLWLGFVGVASYRRMGHAYREHMANPPARTPTVWDDDCD